MTSEERREARYQRRKARRQDKKTARYSGCDSFTDVFSYGNLYRSYKLCRRNVAWKSSVQKYITQAPLNVLNTFQQLHSDKFRTKGFYEFDLVERGKKRHIRSVGIAERVVQRCLCDNALVPMLGRSFIYDNGACMLYKGYSFAIKRMTQHLQEHYRKHGSKGYILQFDFKKFFEQVPHALVKGLIQKEFTDPRLIALTYHFIDAFGNVGLGLGSQISQVLALASADRVDHFVKEACRVRGYGRYNDDGYLIHESKEFLQNYLEGIRRLCSELGITLNEKKTQIVKLSHGFTFLKVRFFLLPTGRVVKKMHHDSVVRMRRKLKAFRLKVDQGIMTYTDVYQSWQSWRAYAKNFDAYHTIRSMAALYEKLFTFPPPALA